MSPIVSPKILSQIVMNGCAAELSEASYVKVIYADLKAPPVAICEPLVIIIGSVLPRERKAGVQYMNRASYASFPNSAFFLNPDETHTGVGFTNEVPLMPSSATLSISTNDSGDGRSCLSECVASALESTNPLEDYPESESVITSRSEHPFTAPSTPSVFSNLVPPSTTATSVPPWGSSRHLADPLQKFGTPPAVSCTRSCSPVDSLDIIRHRRASEAVGASSPSVSVPRVRRHSDVLSLKRLGLRGWHIFRRIKW